MPTIANIGAGTTRSLSPGSIMPVRNRTWPDAEILTNNSANVLTANTVYTQSTKFLLHNTVVYKNSTLTQKLSNTCFRVGSSYFYADNNGWAVGIHNFNGPGDTYISGPQSILDFRTENCTIEMFLYARSLPTWAYSAYPSVGEPRHCQRLTGFFGSSNNGMYNVKKFTFSVDYREGNQYSKINPGFMFHGPCNQMISHDYDTERPVMNEGFIKEQWHHVAAVRNNGSIRLYFNGQLQDVRNMNPTNCDWKASDLNNPLAIGCRAERCNDNITVGMWDGFVSDVRVIKSQALYTGTTYNVPVRPLTATGHRNGSQNISGEIRLLACQDTLKTIGPTLQRTLIGQ
jgi:hypothetical protein